MFNFDESIIEAYTRGDCWVLASELLKHGFPVMVCESSKKTDDWIHVANLLPNHMIVDVEGVWEANEWVERWERTCTEDETAYWGKMVASSKTAEWFAKEIASQFSNRPMFNASNSVSAHAANIIEKLAL